MYINTSLLTEIQKLSSFDVDIPEDCLIKWDVLFKKYREEMTDTLKITEHSVKNEAADEVIKKYKKVNTPDCLKLMTTKEYRI